MPLTSGSLLARRYRLVNRIGEGKLGELWRGADLVPTRQVAIRVIAPQTPVSAEALAAFTDDARLVRTLNNPSIARVLDVGEDDGAPFVVSEVLHGETLEELLERRGTLSPGGALQLVAAIAEGLAEAHRLGVVHLGVEPRAIFLHRTPNGHITPKLCDFARARLLTPKRRPRGEDASGPSLAYHSPEHIADDPRTGAPADVWALGVLLYRCVSGRLPFDGKTAMAQHTQALSAQRIVKEARCLDAGVRDLILECLRYTRGDRISASVLADRARLLAWTTVGGWSDVEKMVRVPEEVSNPDLFGAIDHVSTIPGPLPSEPRMPAARVLPVALPMATNVEPPRVEETLRPVSADVAAVAVTEPTKPRVSISGDLRALRPKASRVLVGAVGSVAAFCIGAFVATAQPTRAPRARHDAPARAVVAAAVEAAEEAPKPRPKPAAAAHPHAGVVNAIAKVAPIAEPVAARALPETATKKPHSVPKTAKSAPPKAEETPEATAPAMSNLQGVPLWDGPLVTSKAKPLPANVGKPADDNPYE